MRSLWVVSVLLPSVFTAAVAEGDWRSKVKVQRNEGFYPLDVVDKLLEDETMPKVDAYVAKRIAAGTNNGCTLENAGVRREWGDMTVEQRADFVNATYCLMTSPSKGPQDQFPGARTRYDDFMSYHLTNAGTLHDTIGLFPAHKYFVLAYETALREECGYNGYHPYMNYDRYTKDPLNSALFNGNETSMGGNGDPDPNYKGFRAGMGGMIPSAGGGGCVTKGPFKDYKANVGPGAPMMPNVPKNPMAGGVGYNPRCMRRDVNAEVAKGATAEKCYDLITLSEDINTFYNTLLTPAPNRSDPYNWGIHTSGHYISGGDPGGDPMVSPGDPIFYFHHAALDRLWWIWQMQDPENRVTAQVSLGGRNTNREIDLKWLAPDKVPVLEAHDSLGGFGGMFCHVYI